MNKLTKSLFHSAAMTFALTTATGALATPITPTVKMTFERSSLFPAGNLVTNIQLNTEFNSRPEVNSNVLAGMFGGQASEGAGFDEKTLYRNNNDVLAYCIDILENLLTGSGGAVYDVKPVGSGTETTDGVTRNFGRMLDFLGAANTVAEEEYGLEFGSLNWLNPAPGGWMSAAFQIGIWESLYEEVTENPLSITTGWFRAGSARRGEGTDFGKAAEFLEDAFSEMNDPAFGNRLDASTVRWLQIDGGQDLLVDPSEVPVPGTLLLTAAGLGLLRYRKKS
ncbi:MAG: hypothetical protein Cons2KO_10560 [Congregibacter sp.]